MKILSLSAVFIAALASVPTLRATFSVSGTIGGSDGVVSILAPITYTVTQTGTADLLVLEDWVTADDGQNLIELNLSYSINGGGVQTITDGIVIDNLSTSNIAGDIDAGDGLITLGGIALTQGDTITFGIQSYSGLSIQADFNPQSIQDFSGSSILRTGGGGSYAILTDVSTFSPIPEPRVYASLAGLAALGLVFYRRRKTA